MAAMLEKVERGRMALVRVLASTLVQVRGRMLDEKCPPWGTRTNP